MAGGLSIGALYANGPEGALELGEFRIKAADVAVELAKKLHTDSGQIGTLGELVITDYGKLRAVAEDPNLAGFTPRTVEGATMERTSKLRPRPRSSSNVTAADSQDPLLDAVAATTWAFIGRYSNRHVLLRGQEQVRVHRRPPSARRR